MTHSDRVLTPDALGAPLTPGHLQPSDVVAGDPSTAALDLLSTQGVDIGLWELTPGTVTDVEVDEVFVVLSGKGQVRFDDGDVIELAPGAIIRLRAGERTTWTITETLRKVYIVLPETGMEN